MPRSEKTKLTLVSQKKYGGYSNLSAIDKKQLWRGFQPHKWEDDQTLERLMDFTDEDGYGAQDCSKRTFMDGETSYHVFTYGLGDNEFGSVHRNTEIPPIISINDGEFVWCGAGADRALLKDLRKACHPDDEDDEEDEDDEPAAKRARKPAKAKVSTTSTGSGASVAPPKKAVGDMSVAELRAELTKRALALPAACPKSTLAAMLNKDIASRQKAVSAVDPSTMTAQELREQCEHLGLDSTGDKRVLIHRVTVELKRLSGKNTSAFDPSLLTVQQLQQWLDKRKIKYLKSKPKEYYVDLVSSAEEEQEEEKKAADAKSMSLSQLQAWLKEHGVRCPAGKKKQFYQDLVEANLDEHAGLLFKEDEILYHKKLFFGQRLVVVQGDITTCKADVIVHPTNGNLTLGGGVGKALAAASGPRFKKEVANWVSTHSKLDIGDCASTKGHELECNFVIHTYSPVFDKADHKGSRAALAESIHKIFKQASKQKLSSIALPSIGSGVNGYPADVAAETILKAITEYFQEAGVVGSSIQEVYFVLFDEASVDVYSESLVNL